MATLGYTYKPIAYDENKYRKGIDTSYYSNAVKEYTAQQEQNRANQLADASNNRATALRDAYIQNQRDKKNTEKSLATAGIRGGMTESSNIKLATNYGNARATAQSNYSNSVNEINRNVDTDIRDYTSDMNSRAEEYRQNLAQAKWQADREDALNNQNAVTDYWTNYYSGTMNNFGDEKKLKKMYSDTLEKLKKAQKSGKSAEITRLQQKLAAIGNRREAIRQSK